jgi:hypothetical protein
MWAEGRGSNMKTEKISLSGEFVLLKYSGRKIIASFVDRYKQTCGRKGKTVRR